MLRNTTYNTKFKGKQTNPKNLHGRTHTTDANMSPASTMIINDKTALKRRVQFVSITKLREVQKTLSSQSEPP